MPLNEEKLFFYFPIEGADGTFFHACAAFGAGVRQRVAVGGFDDCAEAAFLLAQEILIDDVTADFHTDAAFDALHPVMNNRRMTVVIAATDLFAFYRVRLRAVAFGMLLQFAVGLGGTTALNAALAFLADCILA